MPPLNQPFLSSLGRPVHYFPSIDTTMREAARLAELGEPAGALVIAEEQTAGRGRLGRNWTSECGTGLYFSLILRPSLPPEQAPVLTLTLGLAVAQAISRSAGLSCDLRWPNDVLIRGKKCCGILAEMAATGNQVRYVIAGIGINVNQQGFPPELSALATSLLLESGCKHSRKALLAVTLGEIDRHLAILSGEGPSRVIEMFTRASSYASGKQVIVTNGSAETCGVTAGLTPGGVLKLRRDDGAVVPVPAGSVRLAGAPPSAFS